MAEETRIERWRRTGLLQLIVATVVFGVWAYFQKTLPKAEQPVLLNDVLLLALGWLGSTFVFGKKGNGEDPNPKGDNNNDP